GAASAVVLAAFALVQIRRPGVTVLVLLAFSALFLVYGFLTRADMLPLLGTLSVRSASVLAVFIALLSLRAAVAGAPALTRSGIYLVNQPPGRRYGSLTLGSHLFSHILQFGAVT